MNFKPYLLLSLITFSLYSKEPPLIIDHEKEIVFGQSGDFSGHFKYYGLTIRQAILANFEHINASGGIKGKKLRLVSLDDGSEAEKTKSNIEMLYEKHGITKFVGVMGTRAILMILPLIQQKKIAMYFPWGSSPELRNPQLTHIMNAFGLLNPQVDLLIDFLRTNLELQDITLFYANDDLSTAAAKYATEKLKQKNSEPVTAASYNRFTMNILSPAQLLITADPRAVICIATSMPTAKLINHMFQQGFFGTKFYGIDSTYGVNDILQYNSSFFHYSSPVPDPKTSTIECARSYREHLAHIQENPEYSILSFGYYICAMILTDALEKIGNDTENQPIITHLESLKNTQIQGFPINFNPADRYLFGNKVWLI